eukprot:COSAG02_NODE_5292_length_4468_cov_12.959487_2_plen_186_part_00
MREQTGRCALWALHASRLLGHCSNRQRLKQHSRPSSAIRGSPPLRAWPARSIQPSSTPQGLRPRNRGPAPKGPFLSLPAPPLPIPALAIAAPCATAPSIIILHTDFHGAGVSLPCTVRCGHFRMGGHARIGPGNFWRRVDSVSQSASQLARVSRNDGVFPRVIPSAQDCKENYRSSAILHASEPT